MNRLDRLYEGHLTIRDFSVPAGGEWASRLSGWSVIQVDKGSGYYLQPHLNQELAAGAVLLITGAGEASIRASQLGELSFYGFSVTPARLTGIITLVEQEILKAAAARKENAIKILPPNSPSAVKMRELQAGQKRDGLLFRLKLLQLFAEIVGHEPERPVPAEETTDAKQRLRVFLKEMPSPELLGDEFQRIGGSALIAPPVIWAASSMNSKSACPSATSAPPSASKEPANSSPPRTSRSWTWPWKAGSSPSAFLISCSRAILGSVPANGGKSRVSSGKMPELEKTKHRVQPAPACSFAAQEPPPASGRPEGRPPQKRTHAPNRTTGTRRANQLRHGFLRRGLAMVSHRAIGIRTLTLFWQLVFVTASFWGWYFIWQGTFFDRTRLAPPLPFFTTNFSSWSASCSA